MLTFLLCRVQHNLHHFLKFLQVVRKMISEGELDKFIDDFEKRIFPVCYNQ